MLLVHVRVIIGRPIVLRVFVYLCTATCIELREINVNETETFMTSAEDYLVNPFINIDRKVM